MPDVPPPSATSSKVEAVSERWRLIAGAVLLIAGLACGAVIHGSLGNLLAIGLIAVGLLAIVSHVFRRVGLTDERDREHPPRR
jgi:hypothetical protein